MDCDRKYSTLKALRNHVNYKHMRVNEANQINDLSQNNQATNEATTETLNCISHADNNIINGSSSPREVFNVELLSNCDDLSNIDLIDEEPKNIPKPPEVTSFDNVTDFLDAIDEQLNKLFFYAKNCMVTMISVILVWILL